MTISTPTTMKTIPAVISQMPENCFCIMPLHTDAMGHIAGAAAVETSMALGTRVYRSCDI